MNFIITKKSALMLAVLAAYTAPCWGQPDAPEGLNSEALRTWLEAEWYDPYFDDLGYNGARTQMFGYTDEADGMVNRDLHRVSAAGGVCYVLGSHQHRTHRSPEFFRQFVSDEIRPVQHPPHPRQCKLSPGQYTPTDWWRMNRLSGMA